METISVITYLAYLKLIISITLTFALCWGMVVTLQTIPTTKVYLDKIINYGADE